MRKISFNKKKNVPLCITCKKNEVSIEKWDRPCADCKQKKEAVKSEGPIIGSRPPAAVLETEDGVKVFVDKNGKETKNPGYDLQRDPRGWKYNGRAVKKSTIIK